jgi:heme-degrading monooxygenase HmoA
MPLEDLTKRVIIGTWQTRADWEAWHHDAAFTETRRRLEDLEASPSETTWYEIIVEQTPPSVTGRVAGLARQLMDKARKVLPGAAG